MRNYIKSNDLSKDTKKIEEKLEFKPMFPDSIKYVGAESH
jgi:hypothetical protein